MKVLRKVKIALSGSLIAFPAIGLAGVLSVSGYLNILKVEHEYENAVVRDYVNDYSVGIDMFKPYGLRGSSSCTLISDRVHIPALGYADKECDRYAKLSYCHTLRARINQYMKDLCR